MHFILTELSPGIELIAEHFCLRMIAGYPILEFNSADGCEVIFPPSWGDSVCDLYEPSDKLLYENPVQKLFAVVHRISVNSPTFRAVSKNENA